ncbi:MAG: M28 family peptidase [Gemmatimonadaceae bacterium]
MGTAAGDHLAAIAEAPRPAGGGAERAAREHCARALRAIGFVVETQDFVYSTFPGRWGTPIGGAFMIVMFLAAGHLGSQANPRAAVVLLIAGALALGVFARSMGGDAVLDFRHARARSTNLVATRGAPTLWLVAHLDSKSQPVPIAARALGVMVSIAMWIAAAALAFVQLYVPVALGLWIAVTLLGVLASIPVALSIVGARSPGALDDASGVVTVLRTAELLARDKPLGVLLTSAEELGLAGARAWARESASKARGLLGALDSATKSRVGATGSSTHLGVLNIDGVDDFGGLRLIYSGASPRALLGLLGVDWPAPTRFPPGVLMDGVALADVGWEVLNISKGSWRTVSRIHTRGDDLAQLTGCGAEEVATLLAGAITASRR